MQNKTKISALIKTLVSTGLIWLLLQKIDLHTILETIKSCKWDYLCLASCMFILSKIVSAVRLNLFLSLFRINMPLMLNFKLYLLGMFYNLFLPGGIGGDGYKIYFIKKYFSKNTKDIITAILLDRFSGLFILCYLLTVLSLFMERFAYYTYYIVAIILISLFAYYFIQYKLYPHLAASFIHTTLLSISVQVVQLVSAYFILCALNHTADYTSYLFVFLVSSIISVIPFTIGGIGARELTFFIGSQWLQLNTNISISLSLLFFSITAFVSLWGIVYSIKGLKLTKHQITS